MTYLVVQQPEEKPLRNVLSAEKSERRRPALFRDRNEARRAEAQQRPDAHAADTAYRAKAQQRRTHIPHTARGGSPR